MFSSLSLKKLFNNHFGSHGKENGEGEFEEEAGAAAGRGWSGLLTCGHSSGELCVFFWASVSVMISMKYFLPNLLLLLH